MHLSFSIMLNKTQQYLQKLSAEIGSQRSEVCIDIIWPGNEKYNQCMPQGEW